MYYFTEESDFKYLFFEDNLVTISDTGRELGEFTVNISQAKHQVSVCESWVYGQH